jgi:hypothetical protein
MATAKEDAATSTAVSTGCMESGDITMADFCKQCSIDNFGKDFGDLGGNPPLEEGYGYPALCEGCGYILVDSDGACIKCDLMKGKPGHGK